MAKTAKWTYNVLRTIIVTALLLPIVIFSLSYFALSTPWAQNKIKNIAEREVSDFLKTNVTIGKVGISPFNEVLLTGVNVPDQQGDSLIVIDKLGAGISLYNLIFKKRLTFTYGEIIGFHGHISRHDKDAATNMQFIIDAFKPKDDQPPKPFDVQVFNLVIRKSDITYDVLSEPDNHVKFNPNHLNIKDINADISLPRLRNNDFDIDLRRLNFTERSGLDVKNITAHILVNDSATKIENLHCRLPNSVISPDDITLRYKSLKSFGIDVKNSPLQLKLSQTYITPSDLSAFEPKLEGLNTPIDISAQLEMTANRLNLPTLMLKSRDDQLVVDISGNIDNYTDKRNLTIDMSRLLLHGSAQSVANIVNNFTNISPQTKSLITNLGDITLDGNFKGNPNRFNFVGDLYSSLGDINVNGNFNGFSSTTKQFNGTVLTEGFELGKLLDKTELLGSVAMSAKIDGQIVGQQFDGDFDGTIKHIDLKNYRYKNIIANVNAKGNKLGGKLTIDDENGNLSLDGTALLAGAASDYNFTLNANDINLAQMLPGILPINYIDQLNVDAQFTGNNLDNANGNIYIHDLSVIDKNNKSYQLDRLSLSAANNSYPQIINISTNFLDASVKGRYNINTIATSIQNMLAEVFPDVFKHKPLNNGANDFTFNIVVEPSDELDQLMSLPIKPVYRTTVSGHINDFDNSFSANISAPYLQQNNKIIEATTINIAHNNSTSPIQLNASTVMPSKKGKVFLNLDAEGFDNLLSSMVSWRLERDNDYHGAVNLKSLLGRDMNNKITATVDVVPSEIVINDTVWNIEGGRLKYNDRHISVDNIRGGHDKQFIQMYGTVGDDPADELILTLNDISLDYVFQTLNINHVEFGGQATGKFHLSNLFTKTPSLYTPKLHIESMKYNGALMGDGDIESHWDNEQKAVHLGCDLHQRNGETTNINGDIFVADDSLYLEFNANRANVEFMRPFMEAFTSDVRGEVSGKATLFGNFHTIDMFGDIHADSLEMKIDYTNVYYYCKNQDIHIVPGYIELNDITIDDRDNHHAKLNGWLRHNAFHEPSFNFTVTDARDLLTYDITPVINQDWYGTIYGNGSAIISGEPGLVKINVNMESAKRSKFTFVLNDTEEANEYNFITFRDRDNKDLPASMTDNIENDTVPEIVRQLTQKIEQQNESSPSQYIIDLNADITPEAQLILVMDPVGGDQIKANGTGNLRLTYNSETDNFEMYGKYALEKGNYNFTLQDIIIKDFTINSGSTISFNGDPFNAILDIEARYALNANISDLDESFASDREINRTNVPVHALLRVKGEIMQPEISFDLDFPTLTTEAYRKVKSIISTDDMMNRQIIYLLALNRFYTPDYMNNSTRNNELTSVASSTISSQLSSMLGKLSDNWSIMPNFRSDRGDFSDVEVDLALSSQLLDNRLLLNGNFGYRDNTYNTRNSNFIGDFDLEYLLNRRGTIRLKAYNHFNDQNYYVRNAQTTQGVGIVFKHDFDHSSKLFRRHQTPVDSVSVNQDSIK